MATIDGPLEGNGRLSDKSVVEVKPLTKVAETDAIRIKVYTRRWLTLLIFVLFSAANSMQCFQYTIVENIVSR